MSPLMRAWCFHGADELVETEIGGAATEAAMTELLTADLSGLETAVLMIDGLNVAGEMIVVALIITADGVKVPVMALTEIPQVCSSNFLTCEAG